ncbi:hypothetical protein [Neobacillus sp. D3-1R]|uniref:hypothetical protein n=1 Tax=Neobacillus sp. D3-1R TaxID=3445778 RepID=UPI003FA19519
MSQEKRSGNERVIHVDKLVIHAKEVEIINEGRDHGRDRDRDRDHRGPDHRGPRRDPWEFMWGRPRHMEDESSSSSSSSSEVLSENRDGMHRE